MEEREISISLGEELYARAEKIAAARGVSVAEWLSRVAGDATEVAVMQEAWQEFEVIYGSPSDEIKRRVHEEMAASGHFDPETPEHYRMRMAALARLCEPPPEEFEPPEAQATGPEADAEPERRAG